MSPADAAVPATLAGVAAALFTAALRPPSPRVPPRVRPYNSANRVRLGLPADITDPRAMAPFGRGALTGVLGPMAAAAAAGLGRLIDREDDDALLIRLHNAGYLQHVGEAERLHRYRINRLAYVAAAVGAVALLAMASGSAGTLLVGLAPALVLGASLPRAQLDARIARRREQMRIDLHAVNHHLAMTHMAGGGVEEALRRLVTRGRGPVVAELEEALTWRRAGMPLPEALNELASRTPEPHAARTYKSLARAAQTGAPIGDALLHLSEEVRESRRDALARLAVRRRAAMILPIVFLMVPPLLILVGAPLAAELFPQS